ncbi:bifunctional 3-(3-hydroxy-phenyl)propionate/3-hydroxycinnamic acid hydroxylase [Streptomyces nitrosporeus]|uniref:Bifunctional 3-(3-hydroxy-phenyl)propionate/3-hydroxycinnamic acid hydroxylase n=1 Tax=Streptomyces nitrosporeus TaxID=28894 RepID=A0A5J6F5R2_9ACTN|nr:bifunctional 3-(3-hydroxy-phenyl)propionate/3-hydroxycinnamic acid hydroxylase [Streptomyces nitrosporeus]QEU71601.1 bifunctional 3-(3-hydroxy-phenyl)propionate/3-hydroxycinnamic acid hydroxylase [Streptomyces nitrosporeus]GGZ11683.1 3-(3-hydroxy-phenyl)propionate/3-hydroxycinnamic acid hydroxylase [Streptomyces nitrosporeus]
MTTFDTDVVVIGAGPVGLTLANLLGVRGHRATVLEARHELIDYPRGVGLDDESIRTLHTAGLWERVRPFTVPHHVVRLVNGTGRVLATNNPRTQEFGHPRKHGFVQPLVDKELAAGLDRFPGTALRFRHRVVGLEDRGDHVAVTAERHDAAGEPAGTVTVTARYAVGCEGGSSFTRKWMGVEFEGKSPSTRWVVVDVADDPIGTPSVYLGADPRRPYVSIGLPQGIRRWEFMLHDDEPTALCDDPAFMRSLLERHVPDPSALRVINQRTFTHHGRVASGFRKGRVFLAGDAAHLMPVWLGQGWNSGIRDATNLAWKLSAVLAGDADDALLDTYTEERRKHASDMIDVNMAAGTVMKMGRFGGAVRDAAASALNLVPKWKSYFTELRFKPMPRYASGVVVDQATLRPGRAGAGFKRRGALAPFTDSCGELSPVGMQFIQPRVTTADAADALLDDVTGDWWTLATWGTNPTAFLTEADLALVRRHRIRLVSFMPETQRTWAETEFAGSPAPVTVVGDTTGALKDWFDVRACGLVVLRPDHFVAAASLTRQASQVLAALRTAASLTTAPVGEPALEGATA